MANIGTAQVGAVHIPDGAVSEYAAGSISTDSGHFGTSSQDVSITNEAGTPVELWLTGVFAVNSPGGFSLQGSATLAVKRTNDGVYLYQGTFDHSTKNTYSIPVNGQMLDLSASQNQSYTIEVSAAKSGGGGATGEKASISGDLTLIAAKK